MLSFSSLLLLALSSAGPAAAATVCNGYAEYCDRLYSNVTVVGAHNSYTASNTNLAANQDYGVVQQLTDGVRLLQNQVHNQNGTLELCHTSCLIYDGGSLQSYLTKVKTWMDSNPNEVVTLLLVNIDDLPPSNYAPIFQAVGLDQMVWTPPSAAIATNAWPTLGSMIDSGQRLVVLMDYEADFTSVPYIIDEFSNMWEDYYDIEDPSGFNCSVDRYSGDTTDQMYLINHYLYTTSELFGAATPVPNKAALPVTNAASGPGSLGEEAGITCPAIHPRAPTFLLVDFYDWGQGSVFQVAASVNGVQYQAKSIAAQNGTDATTSTSSGSVTSTHNGAGTVVVERSVTWAMALASTSVILGSLMSF